MVLGLSRGNYLHYTIDKIKKWVKLITVLKLKKQYKQIDSKNRLYRLEKLNSFFKKICYKI